MADRKKKSTAEKKRMEEEMEELKLSNEVRTLLPKNTVSTKCNGPVEILANSKNQYVYSLVGN